MPADRQCVAIARPIPLAAPVTTATLSLNSFIVPPLFHTNAVRI